MNNDQMLELQKRIQELEAAKEATDARVNNLEQQMQTVFGLITELYKSQSIEETVETIGSLGKTTLETDKSTFWCVDTVDNKIFTVADNKREYADINSNELLSKAIQLKEAVVADNSAAIPLKSNTGVVMGVIVAENGNFNKSTIDKFSGTGEIGAVCGISLEKERVTQESMSDKLTTLKNRKGLDNYAEKRIINTLSENKPVTFVMCDIDHFKRVNDTYGHAAGDIVLQKVAEILKDNVRNNDSVSRHGGEEFVIALDNTDKVEAFDIADRIRAAIESTSIDIDCGKSINVTISMGVEQISADKTPTKENISTIVDANIAKADKHLYSAKANGRNMVVANLSESEKEQVQQQRNSDSVNVDDAVHKKIIGNTPYNQLGVKAELEFKSGLNNRHAENIAKKLDEAGVKYSGVVTNDKTTITINKADSAKYYAVESAVKKDYSSKSTRSAASEYQQQTSKSIDKAIENQNLDKTR